MSQVTLLVIGLLLVGPAVAEYGWRTRQEYKFAIEGRSLAGLALKPQYAGVHYRGSLYVQVQTPSLLHMKLQDMTYLKIHEEIPKGWWGKVLNSNTPSRDLPITGKTFTVKLDRGQFESVSFEKGIQDWEQNFINGIISQLQMDLVGVNLIHDTSKNIKHRMEKETPVYSVMEDSVLGKCEVTYEVSPYSKSVAMVNNDPLPRDDLCGNRNYLEVIKTKNFSNCEVNVEYHFGLPKTKRCQNGGNQCGTIWSRSSVTRVLGCGERKDFLVLNSVRSSRILTNLHFHNGSQASINSYFNLTLEWVKPTSRHFEQPSETRSIKNLLFKHWGVANLDIKKSFMPLNCKEKKNAANSSAIAKKTKMGRNVFEEVISDEDPVSDERDLASRKSSSSGMLADQPSPQRLSKKKQKKLKRKRITTLLASSSQSNEESQEERKKQIWSVPKSDATHAPYFPFSPYTLAYRQENEGSCLVQQFKDLVNDIVNDFEAPTMVPDARTMEKLYIAVQMCQTMSLRDLEKIVTGIVDTRPRQNQRHLTERKIYRDIITVCGTNPAFQMVKLWIENKIVHGEEAAEIITTLPTNMLTPDSEVLQNFYDLIRSSAVQEDKQLKIVSVLAFSHLLRVACVNKEEREARYSTNIMSSLCTRKDASRYISWMIDQLKSDQEPRVLFIKGLGNTGSSLALPYLQNVAESSKYSAMQRAIAVFSMKFQVFTNETITPNLLSLFHNVEHPTSVRIAAVSMLFYAKPSLSIWQRVAISTWFEPNAAVAAFIRSSLSSFSVIKDPVYNELSQSASLVFSLSKPISLSPYLAYNLLRTSVVETLQQTVLEQFSWIPGPYATNLYYRHTERVGDMSKVGFDGEMHLLNPDAFFTVLQEIVYPSDDVTKVRPMIKTLARSTRWIHDALKIEARTLPRLEGALFLAFHPLAQRMFPFDKRLSVDLAKSGRDFVAELKEGKQFHYQKFGLSTMAVATATEMGFLINMHVDVPWSVRVVGSASTNKSKELNMNTSFAYMSQLIADVNLFTEWDQSIHVAASYGLSLVNLPPISYYAKLNKSMSMVELGVSLQHPKENNVILHHSSKSFTVQEDAFNLDPWSIAKSTRVLHMKDPNQMEMSIVPHVKLVVATEAVKSSPYNYKEDAIAIQGFPMMWSSMESNSFEVHLKNISNITFDIGLGEATLENGQINITRHAGEFKNKNKPDEETSTTGDESEMSGTTPTTVTETTTETTTVATTEATTEATADKSTSTTSSPTTPAQGKETIREKTFTGHSQDMLTYSVDFLEDPLNFNASRLSPFEDQDYGSGYNYLLNQILKGTNQGQAFVVGMNMTVGSEDTKEYTMFASYAGGMAGRLQRLGWFFRNNKTSDEASWTASIYTQSTPVFNFSQILHANMLSRFYSDYDYKEGSEHYQVSLEGRIGRSENKMSSIRNGISRNSNIYRQCRERGDILSPVCYSKMQSASMMNHYNLTISYNDKVNKYYADVATFYLQMAKYNLLPYITESHTEDSDENSLEKSLRVHVALDEDKNTVDMLVHFPSSETEFSGVPVPSLVASLLQKSPEYSMAQRLATTGYCGLSNNSVITFDGVQFKYNLPNCWHLLAKDCSGKSRIAVLVKRTGLLTNLTEVEVNLDNYKVVSLKPGPQVHVNQRLLVLQQDQVAEIKDQEGTLLIQIAVTPDSAIKMALPSHGFLVLYNDNTVIVRADVGTQGRLCGICGDNDNNRINEFTSPRGKLEQSPFEYASSYILKDSECKEYPKESRKN